MWRKRYANGYTYPYFITDNYDDRKYNGNNNEYRKALQNIRKYRKEVIDPYIREKDVEKKYWDSYYYQKNNEGFINTGANLRVDSTPAPGNVLYGAFDAIQQGTGPTQRIGQCIRIKSIAIKGEIYQRQIINQTLGANDLQHAFYRLCVVLDTQNNGTTASIPTVSTPSTVFANVTSDIGTVNPGSTSFKNLTQGKRFRILKEWMGTLDNRGQVFISNFTGPVIKTEFPGDSVAIDWFYPCDIRVDYNADFVVKTNQIYLIGFSNFQTAIDPATGNLYMGLPTARLTMRLRYSDM